MDTGWVKIHRKLLENPIMRKPAYLSLWVTLLLRANHKETKMIWNNQMIIIKEGQFITGREVLSEQTGIHSSTIERILKYLENEHQIEQQKTTKFRLITIVNWKTHQDTNIKLNNKRTTNEQQANTNKNDNNDKKKSHGEFSNVFLKEEEYTKLIDKYGKGQISKLIEELSQYLETSKKRYSSHYATLLNWATRKKLDVVKKEEPREEYNITLSPEQRQKNKEMLAKIRSSLNK